MFHSAQQIVSLEKLSQQSEQQLPFTIKHNGGYIHKPNIDFRISSKNNIQRYVLKTKLIQPPNNQYIRVDEYKQGTLKILNLSKVSLQSKKFLRRHFRIDLKNYLKRKHSKPCFLVPIQSFQCLRLSKTSKQRESKSKKKIEQSNPFKTKILYVFKEWFLINIKQALQQNKIQQIRKNKQKMCKNPFIIFDSRYQVIRGLFIANFACSLVKCVVQACGLQNTFINTSNIYFDYEQLHLNITSIAGICFVNTKQKISIGEYYQIYPYLTEYIYTNGTKLYKKSDKNYKTDQIQKNWRQILNFKIRCILINILSVIINKDIYFEIRKNTSDGWIYWLLVKDQVLQLNKLFKNLLNDVKLKIQIAKIEASLKQNNLMKKNTNQTGLLMLFQNVLVHNKYTTYEQLLSYFTNKDNDQEDICKSKFDRNMEIVHKLIYDREKPQTKQFYQSRGINGLSLYLPIKYSKHLKQFIQQDKWWDQIYLIYTKKYHEIIYKNQLFIYLIAAQILFYDKQVPKQIQIYKNFANIPQMMPYDKQNPYIYKLPELKEIFKTLIKQLTQKEPYHQNQTGVPNSQAPVKASLISQYIKPLDQSG